MFLILPLSLNKSQGNFPLAYRFFRHLLRIRRNHPPALHVGLRAVVWTRRALPREMSGGRSVLICRPSVLSLAFYAAPVPSLCNSICFVTLCACPRVDRSVDWGRCFSVCASFEVKLCCIYCVGASSRNAVSDASSFSRLLTSFTGIM
jgi:hypothetical protein